jgi:Lrp/AsnC family leucine-responsive transcriptional regulator
MPELDKLDRRLLRELDRNSRQSFASLAARLRISAETARYRVNSLVQSGVISRFFTVVDAGKLGSSVHKVLLKLHNVDEKRVQEIIKFLVTNPAVNWVVRFDGIYDLGFTIWTTKLVELSRFLDELKNRYSPFLTRLSLATNIEADFLVRDYFADGMRREEKQAAYTTPQAELQVDSLDRKILNALSRNPRAPATEIAAAAGVTSETIQQRIRRLERNRVITGYRIVVDSAVLEEFNYYLLVYLNYVSRSEIERFEKFCRGHPLVTYVIKALGEWDYELNIEAPAVAVYRDFMMELTRDFSGIVRDHIGIPVGRIYKFTIMPELSG